MRNHDTHRGGLHPVARALLVLALAIPIVAKHVLVDARRIVEPVGPGYTINSSSSSSNNNNNNINSTNTNATGTFHGPCPSENDCGTSGREDYHRLSALHTLGEDSPRDLFVPRISELLQSSVRGLLRKHPSSKVLPRPRDAAFGRDEADPIAEAVFASMNTGGRLFHSTGHVFSVLENCGGPSADPMLVLMVLFHDVIYYSVDANFLEFQLDLLEGVLALVEDEDGDDRRPSEPLALSETATREDPLVAAVAAVFGVEEGAVLPGKATNEFLSAVVATRLLSGWLPLSDLVRLAAGIEATIPFRPVGPSGETALGALHDRLSPLVLLPGNGAAAAAATTTATSTRPTTTEANHEEWRTETLRLAAAMGNCDLASLSTPDRDYFLDSTWSIIPEMNRGMLAPGGPSLGAYRDEFLAMEHRTAFLEGAVPHMFHSYGGVPEEASVEAMRARTRSNLGLEFGYTQVRRLQLLVLTDFVEVLGEDPWALPGLPFLSIREDRDNDRHSEDDDNDDDDDYDDEVLRYLSRGRKTAFPWDPAASPLGALLYRTLGREGVDASVELAKNHRGEPGDLLRACVQGAVLEVLAGAAEDLLGKPRAEIERALGHHGLVRNGGAAAAS